jgi:hypothetical protein
VKAKVQALNAPQHNGRNGHSPGRLTSAAFAEHRIIWRVAMTSPAPRKNTLRSPEPHWRLGRPAGNASAQLHDAQVPVFCYSPMILIRTRLRRPPSNSP